MGFDEESNAPISLSCVRRGSIVERLSLQLLHEITPVQVFSNTAYPRLKENFLNLVPLKIDYMG